MHDHGKSDGLVVPAKPPNNAEFSAAEVVERTIRDASAALAQVAAGLQVEA